MTDVYASIGSTPDFHNSYTYDPDGNVMSVTQQGNGGNAVTDKYVAFGFDDDGNLTGISRYQDTTTAAANCLVATSTYSYDGDGNVTGLVDQDGAQTPNTLASYTWHYDADNRVATSNSTAYGAVTYSYDADSQLTGVSYSSPPAGITSPQSFSYDANGNPNSTGDVTGPNNELLSDGTYCYQYDANGNEIARWVDNNRVSESSPQPGDTEITVYGWDFRNRLTVATTYADYNAYHVTHVASQTILYSYDCFNRRISETVTSGGTTTTQWFVYDGQNLVLQLNATGAVGERYLWGPAVDQVLAEEDASGHVFWPLTDNQGTVRDVVQFNASTGQTTLACHIDYSVFGHMANIVTQSGVNYTPTIGFQGQYWDTAAGSYYCLARWYNPTTARYESADPTGFSAGDANLYTFVFNDPANLLDPTGTRTTTPAVTPLFYECIEDLYTVNRDSGNPNINISVMVEGDTANGRTFVPGTVKADFAYNGTLSFGITYHAWVLSQQWLTKKDAKGRKVTGCRFVVCVNVYELTLPFVVNAFGDMLSENKSRVTDEGELVAGMTFDVTLWADDVGSNCAPPAVMLYSPDYRIRHVQ
jgi:RHS repeat-associated protein